MSASDYMGRVAALSCVLCTELNMVQRTRTTVHHCRTGMGKAQRASDYLTIALCEECHQGRFGLHGDKTYLRIAKLGELDLLALTIKALHEANR